jgi:hypothetical protein
MISYSFVFRRRYKRLRGVSPKGQEENGPSWLDGYRTALKEANHSATQCNSRTAQANTRGPTRIDAPVRQHRETDSNMRLSENNPPHTYRTVARAASKNQTAATPGRCKIAHHRSSKAQADQLPTARR